MKKASKILLLVGGILGIVLAVLWLGLAILWFVRAGMLTAYVNGGTVSEAFKDWTLRWVEANGYYYASAETVIGVWTGKGVTYVVMMLFALPSAIVSFILRGKEKTGLPLPIVLAVLSWSGNIAAFAGAALAIVNWAIVERKEGQEQPKAEEPKKEEEKAE